MKVRCNETQQAFEWSIDIRQGTIYGNDFAGPIAGLITCNGQLPDRRRHTSSARTDPTWPVPPTCRPWFNWAMSAEARTPNSKTGQWSGFGDESPLSNRFGLR